MLEDENAEHPSNAPEDIQVELQHLLKYNYADRFAREKALPVIKNVVEEKEKEIAQPQRVELERK